MLYVEDIVQLHIAALFIKALADAARIDAHSRRTVGRIVQHGVFLALAEHHAACEKALPVEYDLLRRYRHCRAGTGQPGYLAFVICESAYSVFKAVQSVGRELKALAFLIVKVLYAAYRYNYFFHPISL